MESENFLNSLLSLLSKESFHLTKLQEEKLRNVINSNLINLCVYSICRLIIAIIFVVFSFVLLLKYPNNANIKILCWIFPATVLLGYVISGIWAKKNNTKYLTNVLEILEVRDKQLSSTMKSLSELLKTQILLINSMKKKPWWQFW